MVELALAMPLLLVMLFGCIEAGLLFCDAIVLGNAARESVRMASVGAPTNQIGLVVGTTTGCLKGDLLDPPTMQYRVWYGTSWGQPQPLTDVEGRNVAQAGDQVLVTLHYRHPLATGGMLAPLFGGRTEIPITALRVMRRE